MALAFTSARCISIQVMRHLVRVHGCSVVKLVFGRRRSRQGQSRLHKILRSDFGNVQVLKRPRPCGARKSSTFLAFVDVGKESFSDSTRTLYTTITDNIVEPRWYTTGDSHNEHKRERQIRNSISPPKFIISIRLAPIDVLWYHLDSCSG